MHKYVVMAHADGPAGLAQAIVDKVLAQEGNQQVLVLTDPEGLQTYDVVCVFDLDESMDEAAFTALDNEVRDLLTQHPVVAQETLRAFSRDEMNQIHHILFH
jgi:hypothetical protein